MSKTFVGWCVLGILTLALCVYIDVRTNRSLATQEQEQKEKNKRYREMLNGNW